MVDHEFQKLGNYRIIRSLGKGGFAEVYLGEHIHLNKQAAIKVLRTSNQLTEQDLEKFRTEAQTIANLDHPHIINVLDFGIEDNTPFLVMDYAPNGTLRERHPQGTIVPFIDILAYVKQIADALQYAHNRKLIHRDVKPANMLLTRNDNVLLSDFGIVVMAHRTESQVTADVVGTLAYMAPEQFQGKPRTASDQYSLGIVAYEWLCGCRPFNGSLEALMWKHLSEPPTPLHEKIPSIYPAVEDVVLKALAKDPQERFATIEAFSKALEEAFLAQEATILPPTISEIQLQPPSTQTTHLLPPTQSIGTLLGTYQTSTYWKCQLAWSPDSNLIASGDIDGYVHIWNVRIEKEISKYRGHQGVNAVIWTLDEKYILSAGTEGTIQKWDIQTNRKIPLSYQGHTDSVNALSLAPSGKYIASGSSDRTVIVWNIDTGRQYFQYTGHKDEVIAVSWSPHSTLIASADGNRSVHIWDASKKQELYINYLPVNNIAWFPDGSSIGSAKDHSSIQIWDPYTGNVLINYGYIDKTSNPTGVFALSPDGKRIACGVFVEEKKGDRTYLVGKKIHILEVSTGESLFVYEGHSDTISAIAWSPNGNYIASSSNNGVIQIWQATEN